MACDIFEAGVFKAPRPAKITDDFGAGPKYGGAGALPRSSADINVCPFLGVM
jgi:hypothetical protein